MLVICKPLYFEEQLVEKVSSTVGRVSNSSPTWYTIDRVTDARGTERGGGCGVEIVPNNAPGLNRYPWGSSQRFRAILRSVMEKLMNL
jgi:hypothetical protein